MPKWVAAEAMLLFKHSSPVQFRSGDQISMPLRLLSYRQLAVLAFQFGVASNIFAFIYYLRDFRVRLDKWMRWFVPLFVLLFITQMGCIALGLYINY